MEPCSVRNAVMIIYGTLILEIVKAAIEFPRMVEQNVASGSAKFVALAQVFSLGLIFWLVFLISKRNNWARYILMLMFIGGMLLCIKPLIDSLANEPISGLLGLIQLLAEFIAIIMLFNKSSREWFKNPLKT